MNSLYFQKVAFQLNFLTFIEFSIKDSANSLAVLLLYTNR